MRIASLVPSATEMLFALGLGDSVVAVTHECDYPEAARGLPQLTRSVIPPGLAAADIDRAVRERTERGEVLYELDGDRLAELHPDLIVTQALCAVCAVSIDDVRAVAARIASRPRVISLDPETLGEVLGDAHTLGDAAGALDAADALVADAEQRLARVELAVAGTPRPRVAALEWLDPPFAGGHWVPEMVAIAGGEDVLGLAGVKSRAVAWSDVEAADPEVVLTIPCGYDAEGTLREAHGHGRRLAALEARVVAADASAYFSRPGPRLVDGVELLAHALHPDRVPSPPPGRMTVLDAPPAAAVR